MDHLLLSVENQCHQFTSAAAVGIAIAERRRVQRLAFMYKILNDRVAVPPTSVNLVLSSRPTRGINANQQKLVTLRSSTEPYRQSFSIRTAKDWNSLPQSVVAADSSAQFKSQLVRHAHSSSSV